MNLNIENFDPIECHITLNGLLSAGPSGVINLFDFQYGFETD